MEFRCRLVTAAGKIVEDTFQADNEGALRRDLEGRGLHVLALTPRRGLGQLLSWGAGRGRRPSRHEFLVFNQELATLLTAGMTVVQSLALLEEQTTNPVFRAALETVHQRVRGGAALSEAMQEHPDVFPPIYTASVVAGERSGDLDTVLRRYIAYDKVIHNVQRRTLSALIYPFVLTGLSIVLVLIIVLRVVPAFSDFYASFNAELPRSTQLIVLVSDTVLNHVGLVLAGMAGLAAAGLVWWRRPGQRRRMHRVALRLPIVGPALLKFLTAQVARTLATLLGGGIPLVQALGIAARSVGNEHLQEELAAVSERVQEGQSLTAAVAARGVFPDVARKMVEVGESTGSLQAMLTSLADFYDEEIETAVGRFVTLVEPTILVIMGVVIAALVLALYMPLFELSSAV